MEDHIVNMQLGRLSYKQNRYGEDDFEDYLEETG
jgi:hypothetical protein